MITGDNPLTAKAIAEEAGVDDFLAEATPEDKMALIKREQAGGKLVAMTGDGTNDAPALAQADVGVAMNTGTSAAKEAGNMVDLDSNPTKLIEIVEIGKQLLITRGALTTFSIANDVAKYFAIIPALFAAVYPGLDKLNIMGLSSPDSAILSAVVFNALIIIALVPLSLKGVRYRPVSADKMLRRNLTIYGLGGLIAPFIGIKLIDLLISLIPGNRADRHEQLRHEHRPVARAGLRALLVLTLVTGVIYPLAVTGVAQALFHDKANGSEIKADGKVVGSSLIGQAYNLPLKKGQETPEPGPEVVPGPPAERPRHQQRQHAVQADPVRRDQPVRRQQGPHRVGERRQGRRGSARRRPRWTRLHTALPSR